MRTATKTPEIDSHKIRIIKKSTCKPIAPSAKGTLKYDLGFTDTENQTYIRVTNNSGGGFHSNEWIPLKAILAVIEEQPQDQPFKSLIFRRLYVSKGSNNCGFLSAVLRDIGILKAVPGKPYSHLPDDPEKHTEAMQNAIDKGTSLKDQVAEHAKAVEKKRQALAKKMQKASKPSPKAKSKAARKPTTKAKK